MPAPHPAHDARMEDRMKNFNASTNRTTRHVLASASITALAAAFAASLSQPVRADEVTPPTVPASIEVPAGNTPFLVGHAVGTQNYACMPLNNGVAWTLYTPQATCSATRARRSRRTSSAPTRSHLPSFSRPGSTRWTRAPSGSRRRRPLHRLGLRRTRRDRLASSQGRDVRRWPDGWRRTHADHIHPSAEHLGRRRAVDRLLEAARPRQESVRSLHGRLLLLHGRKQLSGR